MDMGATPKPRDSSVFFPHHPTHDFISPFFSKIKISPQVLACGQIMDRMLGVGAVPETPSSGPSVLLQLTRPPVLPSLPSRPVLLPPPWGPRVLGEEAKAGPQTDQLQLGPQLEALEAEGGGVDGEDWPGEEREGGTQRPPGLPVPMEASVSPSQTLS